MSIVCTTGIANTINLPEVLVPKVAATGKRTVDRILFEPYTEEQLSAIVLARCETSLRERAVHAASGNWRTAAAAKHAFCAHPGAFGSDTDSDSDDDDDAAAASGEAASQLASNVFHPAALRLCARKISQKNAGDARKALELAGVAMGASTCRPVLCLDAHSMSCCVLCSGGKAAACVQWQLDRSMLGRSPRYSRRCLLRIQRGVCFIAALTLIMHGLCSLACCESVWMCRSTSQRLCLRWPVTPSLPRRWSAPS